MEIEITLCKKCGIEIPVGTSYYSIVKNLEYYVKDEETNELEIEIKDSEEVVTFCKSCGSYFNTDNLETILKIIPLPGQQFKN